MRRRRRRIYKNQKYDITVDVNALQNVSPSQLVHLDMITATENPFLKSSLPYLFVAKLSLQVNIDATDEVVRCDFINNPSYTILLQANLLSNVERYILQCFTLELESNPAETGLPPPMDENFESLSRFDQTIWVDEDTGIALDRNITCIDLGMKSFDIRDITTRRNSVNCKESNSRRHPIDLNGTQSEHDLNFDSTLNAENEACGRDSSTSPKSNLKDCSTPQSSNNILDELRDEKCIEKKLTLSGNEIYAAQDSHVTQGSNLLNNAYVLKRLGSPFDEVFSPEIRRGRPASNRRAGHDTCFDLETNLLLDSGGTFSRCAGGSCSPITPQEHIVGLPDITLTETQSLSSCDLNDGDGFTGALSLNTQHHATNNKNSNSKCYYKHALNDATVPHSPMPRPPTPERISSVSRGSCEFALPMSLLYSTRSSSPGKRLSVFSQLEEEGLEYAFKASSTVPQYIKRDKNFKYIKVGKVQKFVSLFEERQLGA